MPLTKKYVLIPVNQMVKYLLKCLKKEGFSHYGSAGYSYGKKLQIVLHFLRLSGIGIK
jgi:hypothetical protein